jgi:hypothetical protein
MAVNKLVKDRKTSTNQNDTWHAEKNITKSVQAVAEGPKKNHDKTWHKELQDKPMGIATHVHWVIRNCETNATNLKAMIENIPVHYKNIHENCYPTSRSRIDPKYEQSRIAITSEKAKDLLTSAVKKSTVYKYPENYIYARDTFFVESFNNVLNIFQDKRVSFGDKQYKLQSNLAVCHWNEYLVIFK